MQLIEKAPAKINLSLDTLFKHSDGLHEWQMVMTSIDLADYVQIICHEEPVITVETDSGHIPENQRNLAYQAARLLQEKYHIKTGVQIIIRKQIPVAAGLGGGSSDAAAVLRGLNQLWQLGLSKATLAELGLQIDSDVPYCVYGETALVTGKGERVQPIGELPPLWVVVVKPKISVSTPKILNQLDYAQIKTHPKTEQLVRAIQNQDLFQIVESMGNVLEVITAKCHPEVTRLIHQLTKFGVAVAQMSGSGPTVFGLCTQYSRAQRVYNSMSGFCEEVYLTKVVTPIANNE